MDRSCGKIRTKFEGAWYRAPLFNIELGLQAGAVRFGVPPRILAAILPNIQRSASIQIVPRVIGPRPYHSPLPEVVQPI